MIVLLRRHRILALTGLGAFIASLDVSLANGLLTRIGMSLADERRSALAWIITAYAIVFAATLVPAGSIADRIGRRRVFRGGLWVVALGSLVCTAAPNLPILIAGRVVQAAGAAAAAPASLGLLLDNTEAGQRAVNTARWAGVGALGIGLGPILGGVISASTSWRVAFAINLPLAAAAILAAPRLVRETATQEDEPFPDPVGAVLLAAACGALTLGLSEASDWGITDPRLIASLATACVLAPAFVWRCRSVRNPLLDLTLLTRRQIALTTGITVLYSAGFFGIMYSFVQFLLVRWNLGLAAAGLAMLPMPGAVMVVTTRVGRLAGHTGFRPPIAGGLTLMATGTALTATLVGGAHFGAWWLALLGLIGIGSGLSFPLLAAASVDGLPATTLAAANAVNQCARQVGAALGVAITVAALGTRLAPQITSFHTAWWIAAALFVVSLLLAGALSGSVDHLGRRPQRTTTPVGIPVDAPT